LTLAGIAIAVGVHSRFPTMSEAGLWYDELHSVVRLSDTTLSRSDLITERLSKDTSPPLYYMLLYEIKALGLMTLPPGVPPV
jgi:hypothetical protein